MTKKYVKPRRTEWKGLKPYSNPGLDPFSQQKVAEVGEHVGKALLNGASHPPEGKFLLLQARRVCDFRLAKDLNEKSRLFRQIEKGEEDGHRLGFAADELRLLNRWVMEQDFAGKAEELRQRITKIIGEEDDRS